MAIVITVEPPTGNPRTDTDAINAAIRKANAAYKEALAAGSQEQVTVQLSSGTYVLTADPSNPSVGAVELLSGVALVGGGMAKYNSAGQLTEGTALKLMDNFNAKINGIVRTALETVEHVTIANLTIDGNRANNINEQAGFICGIKEDGSGRVQSDITLSGVEIMNCTAYGFNPHEISYDVLIENCVAHDNGKDGFVADGVVGGIYRNNEAYANARHGFNIQNASENIILEGNVARDNGSGATGGAGIVVQRGDIQRTNEPEIARVTSVQIIGGEYFGNSREGILVKLSDDVTITGASVHDNMRQGVRIEGSSNTILKESVIANNALETTITGTRYDEVQIRMREDFPDGDPDNNPATVPLTKYYSLGTQILNNTIYPQLARSAIREEASNLSGPPTGTVISGNVTAGPVTEGDDTITGSAGADEMRGLGGNDTYTVNHSGDLVIEQAGQGIDQVFSLITYELPANVENLTLTADAGPRNAYGNELNNRITGNAAANNLEGRAGNDTLNGGGGADLLEGGDGNDTYEVNDVNVTIIEKFNNGAGGHDHVISSVSFVLAAEVEDLTLTGSAHLRGTGNAERNVLVGNSGNNILNGMGGADTMGGGLGDDIYYVDHSGDVVIENTGADEDTVISSVSYTLAANVENLVLAGSVVEGRGNELNNVITGNSAANKLFGQDGNDTLSGGGGADTLSGGLGDDVFVLVKGALSGDVILDFSGNGPLAGDRLEFVGFSDQAMLVHSGGDTWTIADRGHFESFQVAGAAAIDPSDYRFVQENATFADPVLVLANYGAGADAGGWTSADRYPRELADVNGDGRADIVAFGEFGTSVALANSYFFV